MHMEVQIVSLLSCPVGLYEPQKTHSLYLTGKNLLGLLEGGKLVVKDPVVIRLYPPQRMFPGSKKKLRIWCFAQTSRDVSLLQGNRNPQYGQGTDIPEVGTNRPLKPHVEILQPLRIPFYMSMLNNK